MFIATYNAIYTVENNGNGEPVQIYEGTEHGKAPHGAMVSLSQRSSRHIRAIGRNATTSVRR